MSSSHTNSDRLTWGLAVLLAVLLFQAGASPANAQAQRDRYAIFISTLATPQVWADSGTPQDWVNRGIIDDYMILDDEVLDLIEELEDVIPNNGSSLLSYIGNTDEIYIQISNRIRNSQVNFSNTDLIIVGHSVGGYAARVMGHIFEQRLLGGIPLFNVGYPASVTVLTVATPHQGIKATHIASNESRDEIIDFSSSLTSVGDAFISGGDQVSDVNRLSYEIVDYRAQFAGGASVLGPTGLRAAIEPGGAVPDFINSLSNPENYLSLYGVEKDMTPVRSAAELAPLFDNGIGQEGTARTKYEGLYFYYDLNRYMWNNCTAIVGGTGAASGVIAGVFIPGLGSLIGGAVGGVFGWGYCVLNGAGPKATRWGRATEELKTLDATWARVIDSYALRRRTGYRYQKVCEPRDGNPVDPFPDREPNPDYGTMFEFIEAPEVAADLEPLFRMNYCAIGESPWQYVPYTYNALVPTKNDGLTGPDFARWSTSSAYDQNVTFDLSNARNGNGYFSDVPDEGGYNFMEIRRSKRAYGSNTTEDVEIPVLSDIHINIPFQSGSIAPPLDNSQRWWSRRLELN